MEGTLESENRRSKRIAARCLGKGGPITPRAEKSISSATPRKASVQGSKKRAASPSIGVSHAEDLVRPSKARCSPRVSEKRAGQGGPLTPRTLKSSAASTPGKVSAKASRKRAATRSVGVAVAQDVPSILAGRLQPKVGRLVCREEEDIHIWHNVKMMEGNRACVSVSSGRRALAHGVNNNYLSCFLQSLFQSRVGMGLRNNLRCHCDMDSCPSCVLRTTALGFSSGSGFLLLDNWEWLLSCLHRVGEHHCVELVKRFFLLFVTFGDSDLCGKDGC